MKIQALLVVRRPDAAPKDGRVAIENRPVAQYDKGASNASPSHEALL
jgi:hypothetical protein